jgi:tetratricopeptide (TPR) repeat protein
MDDRTDAADYTAPLSLPGWMLWFPAILGVWLLYTISSLWYADKQFAMGYQYDRAGLYAQATPSLLTAIALNPQEPMYHDELSGTYATLAVSAFSAKDATEAANLAELALSESDKAVHTSPNNVNFLKTRTKVYYTLSALDATFNAAAINTLLQASALSPNDPKIYYNLAILAGRNGQNDQAISYLLRAKALKPDYRDVYNALNIFYTEMGKKDAAKAILEEYLTKIDPTDTQFKQTVAK